VRMGYQVQGGAQVSEVGVSRWHFNPADKKTLSVTFEAPAEAGAYELRMLDRNGSHYVLDTIGLKVTGAPRVNLPLGEVRDTPLPSPGHDEGLPLPNPNTFNIDNDRPPSALDRIDNQVGAARTGKKLADFYTDLEEILKKPQDQWTAEDAQRVAGHLAGLIPDRFEGLQRFFEANLGRVENAREVIGLARDAYSLLNPDPNDPLWELRAFKTYLGMMQKIADKVPGIGQFYGQYVEAVDSMIKSAEEINRGRERTNRAIELWDDVLNGTYKTAEDPNRARLDREFDNFVGGLDKLQGAGAAGLSDADGRNITGATQATHRPWYNVCFDIKVAIESINRNRQLLKQEIDARRADSQRAVQARQTIKLAQSALERLMVREPALRRAYRSDYHYFRSLAVMRDNPELGRLGHQELRRRADAEARRESQVPLREFPDAPVILPPLQADPETL
jgi:hypothetical protein